MSQDWTAHPAGRSRALTWIRLLGVAATVSLAGSAAFTLVTPENPPDQEWLEPERSCGEPGDIDEACLKRGPWLIGLPRVQAVQRARLYRHLGTSMASPQEAVPVSLVELANYAQDPAGAKLAHELAQDGWVYAADDIVADDVVEALQQGGPQVEAATAATAADVERYVQLVEVAFADAKTGLATIDEGNLKAWERRTSATRSWMALARPALILGVALVLALLSLLVLARRKIWTKIPIRLDDEALHIGEVRVARADIERVDLQSGAVHTRQRGVVAFEPIELAPDHQGAFERSVQGS